MSADQQLFQPKGMIRLTGDCQCIIIKQTTSNQGWSKHMGNTSMMISKNVKQNIQLSLPNEPEPAVD